MVEQRLPWRCLLGWHSWTAMGAGGGWAMDMGRKTGGVIVGWVRCQRCNERRLRAFNV